MNLEKYYDYLKFQLQLFATLFIGTTAIFWVLSSQGEPNLIVALAVVLSIFAFLYYTGQFAIVSRKYLKSK